MSTTYKLLLVAKRKLAYVILTASTAITILKFLSTNSSWKLCRGSSRRCCCSMLTLVTSTMTFFENSLHIKWCIELLFSMSWISHVWLVYMESTTANLFLHKLLIVPHPYWSWCIWIYVVQCDNSQRLLIFHAYNL